MCYQGLQYSGLTKPRWQSFRRHLVDVSTHHCRFTSATAMRDERRLTLLEVLGELVLSVWCMAEERSSADARRDIDSPTAHLDVDVVAGNVALLTTKHHGKGMLSCWKNKARLRIIQNTPHIPLLASTPWSPVDCIFGPSSRAVFMND